MIKLVAFDLSGVLFIESHIVRNLLYPMLPEPKDYREVKEKYKRFRSGEITSHQFWKSILGKDGESFERKYLDSFVLDPHYFDVVTYLKEKYKLAILSNMPAEWGDYLIKKFGFETLFDPIVISGKVRASKPNKNIYKILQKKSKVPFEQMIFIDDKKKCLKPASQLGMKTVWFNRERDEFDFHPHYIIKSLQDLKKIL